MKKREGKSVLYGMAAMVVFIAGFTGCAKTAAPVTNPIATYVSVLNTAQYSTDVFLNGTLSSPAGGIPSGSFSAKYAGLKPGSYEVQFKKAGADSLLADLPSTIYDTTGFYTLILYSDTTSGMAHAVKITDNFSTISTYNTNYRFFNLAPDAPQVDVYLNSILSQSHRSSADSLTSSPFATFLQIPPAIYNIVVTASGNPTDTLASNTAANLVTGDIYTIFLSEIKNGGVPKFTLNILPAAY